MAEKHQKKWRKGGKNSAENRSREVWRKPENDSFESQKLKNTVCVKRNAHLIPIFFVAPLGEGGEKFTLSILYLGVLPLPQGGHKKICN